jgi:hypothetical protein
MRKVESSAATSWSGVEDVLEVVISRTVEPGVG